MSKLYELKNGGEHQNNGILVTRQRNLCCEVKSEIGADGNNDIKPVATEAASSRLDLTNENSKIQNDDVGAIYAFFYIQ